MKKILLTLALAGVLLPAFAQKDEQKIKETMIASEPVRISHTTPYAVLPSDVMPFNHSSIVENIDDSVTITETNKQMGTLAFKNRYDRHTQGSIYDMMHVHDDGFIAGVWTASTDGISNLEERDIVYSCSKDKGENWEIDFEVTGGSHGYWPSYAPWGENGELIVVRFGDKDISGHDGLSVFRRENKGEGDWERIDIPNPTEDGFMAWQKICVTGENNQFLHVATGYSIDTSTRYDGFQSPLLYNRSSNGGETWDFPEWRALPNIVGDDELDEYANLSEVHVWAQPYGNNIAMLLSRLGYDSFIYKSDNNGDPGSWSKIDVMNCSWDLNPGPNQKVDSGWRAMQGGSLAFDKRGKLHAAFNAFWTRPGTDPGEENTYYYNKLGYGSVMLYWNESRGVYELEKLADTIDAWARQAYYIYEENGDEYINLTVARPSFNEYVIAGPIPLDTEGEVLGNGLTYYDYSFVEESMLWNTIKSYRQVGAWPFPNIIFNKDNGLHLVYLGLLDGADDGNGKQRRHIYHTFTRDEFKTHAVHTDLSNRLAIKNHEFSYLKVGGWIEDDTFAFMAQVDIYAGTHCDTGWGEVHTATDNTMRAFVATYVDNGPKGLNDLDKAKVDMNVFPNPATGTVSVDFVGKCNIELYNMVGQKVYHAEKISGPHNISLQGLASGVYFVTVRDGKKASTKKLIVQ